MRVNKGKIIEMFQMRGQHDRATRADDELPDVVDTLEHRELLDEVGVDPREMVNRIPPGDLDGKR